MTLIRRGRVTSNMFVKEPEGMIFREYIKVYKLYIQMIYMPSQINNFTIYACTILPIFKLIETERYCSKWVRIMTKEESVFSVGFVSDSTLLL